MKINHSRFADARLRHLFTIITVLGVLAAACIAGAAVKQPQPKLGVANTFTLTICDDEPCWTTPIGGAQAHIKNVRSSDTSVVMQTSTAPTNILIQGKKVGSTIVTLDILPRAPRYVHITIEVTVVKCPKPGKVGPPLKPVTLPGKPVTLPEKAGHDPCKAGRPVGAEEFSR